MKKGAIVDIRFWDHAAGGDAEIIECACVGRVVKENALSITLEYWSILNESVEMIKENCERIAIAKSTIIEIIEYAPKRAKRNY